MGTFHFEPSARLQKFLGRELIADPNVAVAEFVKNSYDAGAQHVLIDFLIEARERNEQEIVISDDGTGMNKDSFDRNWMHPGYSEKVDRVAPTTPMGDSDAEQLAAGRVPIGEKGVGRLAAGRLGEFVEVFTRKTTTEKWLHVVFDWSKFDSMHMPLNQVEVPYDHETPPDSPHFATGTIVRIVQLSLDWRSRVPGRKVSGRSDLRLGRLKEDLSVLVQPLSSGTLAFRVDIDIDDPQFDEQVGIIEAGEPDWDAYQFEFELEEAADGRARLKRRIRRAPNIAADVGKPKTQEFAWSVVGPQSTAAYEDDRRPQTLRCGSFSGYFLYTTVPWKRRGRVGSPPGVLLFRDGVRVLPYGDDDDDWLGAKSRKASRQGYAIQPDNLWGRVLVTKAGNPGLTDMSNRSGLVENDAYEDFVSHVRAEFRFFSDMILEEYIRPNWTPPEDRAKQQASDNLDYQQAVAQLAVHRMRGPLGAIRVDVQAASRLLRRIEDRALAQRLEEKLQRADGTINDLDAALEEYFTLSSQPAPEVEEFDIPAAVRDAVRQVQPAAEARDIQITVNLAPTRPIAFARGVLVDSIGNLLNNAIEVARPTTRAPGSIEVSTQRGGRGVRIYVEDDGIGMGADERRALFSETRTQKGHVGLGLARARRSLRLLGADVDIEESTTSGSRFYIDLPTMARQRKRGG